MTTLQSQRQMFEAFAHSERPGLSLARDAEDYSDPLAQTMWRAWSGGERAASTAPDGWVLVRKAPTPGLLMSMALRQDHAIGCPGYYDQPMFSSGGLTHAMRLAAALKGMAQIHEEVVGAGFHTPADESRHLALLGGAVSGP